MIVEYILYILLYIIHNIYNHMKYTHFILYNAPKMSMCHRSNFLAGGSACIGGFAGL